MATLFTFRIESNVVKVIAADQKALVAAMRKVVVGRAKWGQGRIRRDIAAAGYGNKIPRAVRMKSVDIPDGVEATIFSSARLKRPGGLFDLIGLYQQDLFIQGTGGRSKSVPGASFLQQNISGKFLTIPNTAVVGRTFRGGLPRVSDFPSGTFIAKMGPAGGVLVLRDDPTGPAYFFLSPYARQKGRLSLAKTKGLLGRDLSVNIIRDWRRRRVSVQLQLLAAA